MEDSRRRGRGRLQDRRAAIAGVRILPLVGAGDVVECRAAEARLRPRFFIGLQTVCNPLIKK